MRKDKFLYNFLRINFLDLENINKTDYIKNSSARGSKAARAEHYISIVLINVMIKKSLLILFQLFQKQQLLYPNVL